LRKVIKNRLWGFGPGEREVTGIDLNKEMGRCWV